MQNEFPGFPDLPKELRRQIWEDAVNGRIVRIRWEDSGTKREKVTPEYGTRYHNIAQACKESREITRNLANIVLTEGNPNPGSGWPTVMRSDLYSSDTLYFPNFWDGITSWYEEFPAGTKDHPSHIFRGVKRVTIGKDDLPFHRISMITNFLSQLRTLES